MRAVVSQASGTQASGKRVRVTCVDDNPHVGRALEVYLRLEPDLEWCGWLAESDALRELVHGEMRPDVIIMDIDMPGRDSFEVTRELHDSFPASRVIMFSGYVRADIIDRAVEAGAWGFVSKNDGEESLLASIRDVAAGKFVLSPTARAVYERP